MFNKKILATVSLILAAVVLLITGCGSENEPEPTTAEPTSAVNAETTVNSSDEITVTVENKEENVSESTTYTEETSAPEKESSTAEETSVSAVPQTVEEIVELFNKSANRIKSEAKTVTKNWEKRTVNKDKTDIPDAIESFAENMLTTLMGDDTEPTVYDTREEIRTEFLVPDQDYVSKLKAESVAKATCTDNGKEYEIYLMLKDHKNPTAGVGVGSVCDVIESAEVADGAPFVEEFSTEYYSCEVRVAIDKETGKVTHANYKTPLVLLLRVQLFGTHSGSIGFTFEKDYTITY